MENFAIPNLREVSENPPNKEAYHEHVSTTYRQPANSAVTGTMDASWAFGLGLQGAVFMNTVEERGKAPGTDCPRPGRSLRVLVAPDSFKGCLGAHEVAARIAAGVRQAIPGCCVTEAPIADGGEGTASVVRLALGGSWHGVRVLDANGEPVTVPFALCHNADFGDFAIVDVAEAIGLPKAVAIPARRTSRGVGQIVRAIAELGYKTIVLGLGGSSTNDGGAGMLAELAFQFFDEEDVPFHPVFDDLSLIRRISRRTDADWIDGIRLIGLTDVTSPLAGPNGASMVFGKQKGFSDTEYADRVLQAFGAQCDAFVGGSFAGREGSGAAGGLGYALCLLGAELRPGGAFILDTLRLAQRAAGVDWIITGEGRSDKQTALGKGPALVARLARDNGVPVTLLSGAVDHDASLEAAFDGCFSIQSGPVSLDHAMRNAGPLLEAASRQLAAMFARLHAAA